MSSWTDEDEDGGTCPSSPSVMFVGRRRHSRGQHRIWMPLPHFPGLGHSMNPIQYLPQLNFLPPPLMTPIPLGGPTSSILLASSTLRSPISTSSAGNTSSCSAGAG